jgi:polyribonucleotide 5'-hydroxyl-kinase
MTQYLNVFDGFDKLRAKRSQEKKDGPKVVLVGPTDSGKSSLCKLLLNWSVRKDFQPTFIDLDVGEFNSFN